MNKFYPVILIILAAFLFLIGNNSIALTDPDETFYSLTAKEMMNKGSFMIPYIFDQPQFEKPPFFYWLLMLSFKVFGIIPFAARFIPAIFGIIGVIGAYVYLSRIFNKEISFYSSLVLATSLIYMGLSKAVITDIVFSVFMFFSFFSFYIWYKERKSLLPFAVFLALAVLTKGPVSLVMMGLAVVLFSILIKDKALVKQFIFNNWWFLFLIIALPWYLYVSIKFGKIFYDEFIINDNIRRILEAEHKNFDRWWFYPAVLLGGAFPWTFYYLFIGEKFKEYKKEYLFLFSWIASVFVVFTAAHSKLISYIVPLYAAICVMIGIGLTGLKNKPKRVKAVGVLDLVLALVLFAPLWYVKKEYPDFFISVLLGVIFLSVSLAISGIMLIKKNFKKAIFYNVIGLVCVAIILPATFPFKAIEPAFCDNDLIRIVKDYNYKGPILASKLFARGSSFNTGNPVTVLGKNGSPFWSAHPVDVVNINEDSSVTNFFNDKDRVICVIRTKELKRLEEVFSGSRVNTILSGSFGRSVVLSDKKQ